MAFRWGCSAEKQNCGMFKESVRRKANLIYCTYSLKSLLFPVLFPVLSFKWTNGLYGRTKGGCLGRS